MSNNKPIYELDKDECNARRTTLKNDIADLQSAINNNQVKIVFGRKYPVKMYLKGVQTTIEDFVLTEDFENLVSEGTENFGTLCGALFTGDKENPVNNDELKLICENIGISKSVFWKVLWKAIKVEYYKNQIELVDKRLDFLRKEEEKEKKVGEK